MKKRLFVILMALALILAACAIAQADGTAGCDAWLKAATEEASKADHVIGGDNGIEDKQSMTIIMPGETVAIIPETGVALDGIQGGISNQVIKIVQLNDPVVNTDYLKTSKPTKTTFTELKKKEVPFFYGDRDVTGDPVRATEGPTSVEYVSLYRNDTGLPVLVRGQHWQAGQFLHTKSSDTVYGCGRDSVGGRVNFQTSSYFDYAPIFWFVEPYYDINLWTKTSSGTPYEWRTDDYKTTYKLYVDREDHTYEFDNPMVEGWCFTTWQEQKVAGTAFPIKDNGTLANGKTTFTWNMQTQLTKNGDLDPQYFTTDHELAGVFLVNGRTARFFANGGTINGKETLLIEAGHDDEFSLSLKDYTPVREGYTFLGWGTDKDNPAGSLVSDTNLKEWFNQNHMELYAAWEQEKARTETEEQDNTQTATEEQGQKNETPVHRGWLLNADGSWSYFNADGEAVTGVQTVDGTLYCFDGQGRMVTGWAYVDGKWYYAGASGALFNGGWTNAGGIWYYFRSSGEMATGWVYDGGAYYYMNNDGTMATGWIVDNGEWYYMSSSGAMYTGWLSSGGSWYLIGPAGTMTTGWYVEGGVWYYFLDSGAMATGWQLIDGQWEMFGDNGAWLYSWNG